MSQRLPPLNALRAFEAAARLGSFARAATELNVTATAISQQVRTLEQYLDIALFERRPAGLLLTDLGRSLLPELTSGFERLRIASELARAGQHAGPLTLTMLPALATGWLLPRWPDFQRRHPRIELVLRTDRHLVDFRRHAVDLAIRFAAAGTPGLRAVPLLHEDLFPVASPALVEGRAPPRTLADLATWPLLHDLDAEPNQPWMSWYAWFDRAGIALPSSTTVAMRFTDSSVMLDAASRGQGVMLGRSHFVAESLRRGALVRLTPDEWRAEWRYWLTAPAAHFNRPRVRAFVTWARQQATAG